MVPMFKHAWKVLVRDEAAARRLVRALLLGFGVTGVGAVPYAPEPARLYLWLGAGLAACIGGLIGAIPTDDQVLTKTERAVAAREAASGVQNAL